MSFKPIEMMVGERLVIRYQMTNASTGSYINISGYSFAFTIKDDITSSTVTIGPVAGSIIDASYGKFQYTIRGSVTQSMTAFRGRALGFFYDLNNSMAVFTPRDGIHFCLTWSGL